MVERSELVAYLDKRLQTASFPGDPSNNGLQVEGRPDVRKAIFAVDASLALFRKATQKKADFLFVHHGLSWGSGFQRLVDGDAARMNVLFREGMSLYASHLPLDAHPELGHNARIARLLGLRKTQRFAEYGGGLIGVHGTLPKTVQTRNFLRLVESVLECPITGLLGGIPPTLRRIGIISGNAGSDGIRAASESGLECLITGEIGHTQFHLAHESGLLVAAIGHYRSETPGVFAVMDEIRQKFSVACEFLDIPTGM
jgi:dinuclear metal center YbgI/SA1388 family protein